MQKDDHVTKGEFESFKKHIDYKFESIDGKFEAIDRRFESIDRKFAHIDEKFNSIDQKFDEFRDLLVETANHLVAKIDSIGERMDVFIKQNALDHHSFDTRLAKLEARMQQL